MTDNSFLGDKSRTITRGNHFDSLNYISFATVISIANDRLRFENRKERLLFHDKVAENISLYVGKCRNFGVDFEDSWEVSDEMQSFYSYSTARWSKIREK